MKLTKILETSINEELDLTETSDLFMWEISLQNLQEVDSVLIAPSKTRAAIKLKLQKSLDAVKNEYNQIMAMFYYFDDKSLGTISEKVLASLVEKTGIFKQGTVAQTGGSGGLSDLEIAGQGVSLKTTLVGSAINLGSAAGEGGIEPGDSTLPNKSIKNKKLRASKIKIKKLTEVPYGAVDRKVSNICKKIGDDLFLWAAVSKDKKTKKLAGFTFYLMDINGDVLYKDIMKNGSIELQDGGNGKSFNIYTGDDVMFSKGDAQGKYFNLAPAFVQSQFKETDSKLSEGKSTVSTKDVTTKYTTGTKMKVTVDPTADKGTSFNFTEISKKVFNTMLSILTDPENMRKIVASIPV